MPDARPAVQSAPSVIGPEKGKAIAEVTRKVFGSIPRRIAFPAGENRWTFLVDLDGATWMVARRDSEDDAQMEARVLKGLSQTGLVPRFKAISGRWTIQEFVCGVRLPILLDELTDMGERERVVAQSLEALLAVHAKANHSGLARALPVIGKEASWFFNSVASARQFAKSHDLPPPNLDEQKLAALMFGPRQQFIKYDARPGNALVDGKRTCWFDWEDCGRGNPVEDLAFVLFDEWMPLDEASEKRLVDTFVPEFGSGDGKFSTEDHLVRYGTVHITERLQRCLKFHLRDGRFWDRNSALAGDKAGNTRREMVRLVARGLRWCDRLPETRGYRAWLMGIRDRFDLPQSGETVSDALAA